MLLPRLQPPLRTAVKAIGRSSQQACLNEAFGALAIRGGGPSISPASLTFVRHASHAQQGAVNKAKDGPGKRLGAKKSGEQYVIPGNIIFRQRGTHWFPGDNCGMGRDHTIYATEAGYVKYYKDPERHPKRQYIGVTFERSQVLPLPRNSMRRRKLNMFAQKMETAPIEAPRPDLFLATDGSQAVVIKETPVEQKPLKLKSGYMYRKSNWEIGRAAERAKIQVKEFKPRDRWAAWKKTIKRRAANREKRVVGGKKTKKKGRKSMSRTT
ncbi:ribosomal L27 protein-domain-containing protein [Amylocarpus encephaloides]|uniref:Large ribosomal subunit protein bL27m n=1 Tax=Amylocarpus encephaloides TaxID=45428 RepID=A0A9P7YKI6_9HELO|nr:ribosomal L27 protein-domain-containing protein [Amylocarpus encephaloides]